MFMESWVLRVSCKVNMKPFRLHLLCKKPEVFMEWWILRVSCKVNMKLFRPLDYFTWDPKYSSFHEHSKNQIHFLNIGARSRLTENVLTSLSLRHSMTILNNFLKFHIYKPRVYGDTCVTPCLCTWKHHIFQRWWEHVLRYLPSPFYTRV